MTQEMSDEHKKAIDSAIASLMQEVSDKGGYTCTGCQQPKQNEPHQIGVFFSEKPEPRLSVYPLCKVCSLKSKVDRLFKDNVLARVKEQVAKSIASGDETQATDKQKEFTTADYTVLKEAQGEFHVRFPSGKNFTMKGTFRVMDFAGRGVSPTMEDTEGKNFVLDPRSLVTQGKEFVYRPRKYALSAEMDKWLKEHPEWAPEPS